MTLFMIYQHSLDDKSSSLKLAVAFCFASENHFGLPGDIKLGPSDQYVDKEAC